MELNENFAYSGTKQNFDRDSYATLADMKAVKAKKMPSIFHAMCEETGKLYIYNKKNTDDEVLGKWREVGGSAEAGSNPGIGSSTETLFNNNGPELEIYGFTQGHISSDQMFETIGNSYYARYTGDYGRGNEPFIPGNVESRADSATVYIENAPMFGTSKCRLFATNTQGQVFEGFFVTTRTEPTFTSDGLVWRKVENENENANGSCECEEDTDTIDFSTWPEYTSPEANGIVLDGQGGANIDDSNISVDPDDIEEED